MPTRPNILIFLMDTQPVRNMTCYGFAQNTTPNVQKIADEGLVYDQHYGTGAWTVPTHASLFTGKYQSGHGAGAQYEYLSRSFPTLAEALNENGYATIGFNNNSWVSQDETNIARGFSQWVMIPRPMGRNVQAGPEDEYIVETNVDSGASSTIDAIMQWFDHERDASKPFFMFVNCIEPHLRVWAPEPFRSRFLLSGVSQAQARRVNQDEYAERLGTVPDRADGHMTQADWDILKSLYDGETAYLDSRMGIVFDFLRARGILDETLLIITADHGDLLERRGLMGHHLALFDDLIHTPLIVRKPGLIPQSARFSGFVQICDWFPTFLDLLDIRSDKLAGEIHGVSMAPTWRGEPTRDFALAEYQKGVQVVERALRIAPLDWDYRPWLRRIKTIRAGQFKYHWYSDGADLLFDVSADPGERHNLIAERPEIATELRKKIESLLLSVKRHDFGDKLRNHGFRNVRWDNMARLSALGAYREIEDGGDS
ncbi:MAG: sulfatase [Chloroflexi bacterium]|nr:sulfatase [Chloroflexota bacterium]